MTIWRAARYKAGDFRAPGRLWQDYDPDKAPAPSRLERSLDELGVTYYLPISLQVKRHRLKRSAQVKRHGLLHGYVFIADPCPYQPVEDLPTITKFIRIGHKLAIISEEQVEKIRKAEADLMALSMAHIEEMMAEKAARQTRRMRSDKFPPGTIATIREGHLLAGQEIEVRAHKARGYVETFIKSLNQLVDIPVSALDAA